jgi:hypothetical protein
MSSAILYLAIVVIWACVLIPRWLRRDTARAACAGQAAPHADTSTTTSTEAGAADPGDAGADPGDASADPGDDVRRADHVPAEGDAGLALASPGESRRRVLAARRRLLWMMLGLEVAGIGLALTALAAWWVIAPPTVMLGGYLLLLREAALADREADQREREAREARREARARRATKAAARAARPAPAPSAPVVLAAAPVAADYSDLGGGRDFTPGLHYASSSDTPDEDDAYDQCTQNRLRAVGD